ncbi:MAG: alpha/beta hydrolase-fold protein [bacterium]|nr:alpha/beta hydrolase-fold protein [bacterium]
MTHWQPYTQTVAQHTVTGDVRVWKQLYSPQLHNTRDLLVWLPPGYDTTMARYPVVYMHDGQNLFDAFTSYVGEWHADETMTALYAENVAAIIVGIANIGEARRSEYTPYDHASPRMPIKANGERYLDFIDETVKPLIDASFRTLAAPESTAIAGSSMGGLISLYGFLTRPAVYGACGAFSPSFWLADSAITRHAASLAARRPSRGRLYLDIGGREGEVMVRWHGEPDAAAKANAAYLNGVRLLRDALIAGGYTEGDTLYYVEAPEAAHHENDWAARLPAAMRWLLAGHLTSG